MKLKLIKNEPFLYNSKRFKEYLDAKLAYK